ncbi:octopamine receptor beta-2R-like [Actinia tenebrosa]|uniref:Octopamine receptor beta-2R-like n=1 Tax=Actinia tenebrosa TaxID=6105 RepID=A0A6P8J6U6_ACTTE|nr:octopamine receptor beta-2R-like [Actinia tenebrosa]XP_031575523.1 octopamine receptor beta-2R-like [Actinia tenebrosa]XP_031575524.1 octopamine receptor beta-2R-like [Actinia tenebrosa]XP_031575525.1 octopamine receptor beta-2R-like [Actinia tenebrosa]XP_031575526.1 octopamine receptor beta-2R-like [Actinia tenebrosa]XP_031575527.1 octopamine receptor beta-2R-like [Actinia tenebrosa]XP_031575528.1 octopamine receptor beta-2R-like [Actinia tenebrosa]XP_031575529.1 octopamine receptor beta
MMDFEDVTSKTMNRSNENLTTTSHGQGSGVLLNEQELKVFQATMSILCVLIVATNVLVCLLVYINKNIRSFTNGFVVSLAISDIMMGAIFFPVHLAVPDFSGIGYMTAISLLLGVSNVCCVTYDRYLSISSPLTYTMDIQQLFKRMIIACWSVPILFSLIPVIWDNNSYLIAHKVYIFILEIGGVIIPYAFVFAVYFYIFKQVQKCTNRLQTELSDQQTVQTKKKRLFFELKVARVFITIASVFLLCWAPLLYITTAVTLGRSDLVPEVLTVIAFYMLALESLINPLIYCFLKPDIQSAIRRTIRKTWRRDVTIRFHSKAAESAGIIIGTSNTNLRNCHNSNEHISAI